MALCLRSDNRDEARILQLRGDFQVVSGRFATVDQRDTNHLRPYLMLDRPNRAMHYDYRPRPR